MRQFWSFIALAVRVYLHNAIWKQERFSFVFLKYCQGLAHTYRLNPWHLRFHKFASVFYTKILFSPFCRKVWVWAPKSTCKLTKNELLLNIRLRIKSSDYSDSFRKIAELISQIIFLPKILYKYFCCNCTLSVTITLIHFTVWFKCPHILQHIEFWSFPVTILAYNLLFASKWQKGYKWKNK